ncbi:uncharacterized protein LOC108203257 [Daucus carota subsp. sativus]|uniref:uncharacterized protein LOC108203257 n=1 Tax=Daucus carota subsp. sativus TaxID=79200 RepID=UPI003083A242
MDDSDMCIGLGDDFDEMIRNEGRARNGMNKAAKDFYKLVQEGKQPLFPGSENFTQLGFIVRLYQLKCSHGFTESAFSGILQLLKEAFPNVNLPSYFSVAKKMIRDLGLDYEKIHACPNDCMLYWSENKDEIKCKFCGASRWVVPKKDSRAPSSTKVQENSSKIPAKVLRYFPLKPRLQRLFMCKEYSELMKWHAVGRTKDGKLRHPADAEGWRSMDASHSKFAAEIRNVRLGLAADGVNPYRSMNISHSTWPVVLVNYNLPPWLIMKPENLILSKLIPGPEYPGNDIDVYLQPLVAELKELWDIGLETCDSHADQTFTLHASLLWTISDFPGYAVLSGWSTKGKLGCPNCHYCTSSTYLKHSRKVVYMNHRKFLPPGHKLRYDCKRFNGMVETDVSPPPLSGMDIEELLFGYENCFGKRDLKKRKRETGCPFKKKSIFFELPYWRKNLVRHNLDLMHIEKNICDKILGTLLNLGGRTKDHLSARKDLQEMGIRKALHPLRIGDTNQYEIRAAIFDMTKKEKELFCSVFKNAKLPHGTASNISRCVHIAERKIFGYKSHDAHFMLQYLLQFAVVKTSKPEVAVALLRLSAFFRGLCGKVIDLEDIPKLQEEIIEILCQLETIFPPAFFDIMVHLPVHLCKELEFGGPVHLRWMFGIERYLCKLKSYVRNRSKPEGSMAEGYLADECITFCSRFLNDTIKTKNEQNIHVGYSIGSRRNKDGKSVELEDKDWIKVHRYVLFNCGNIEIEKLLGEHHTLIESHGKSKKYAREKSHTVKFHHWLKDEVQKLKEPSSELLNLSRGPQRAAKKYSAHVVNGFRFHTKKRDAKCTTQNSGVILTALTTCFASSKDKNPTIGDVTYFGAIEEIIEVDYWGAITVVLFRCCWYEKDKDCYGLTRVNFSKNIQKDDPFVLATQVQQIFYIQDCIENNLHFVVKKLPKEYDNIGIETDVLEDVYGPTVHDTGLNFKMQNQRDDVSWCKDDMPGEMCRESFSGDEADDEDIE